MSAWCRILGTAVLPFSQEEANKALHLTAIYLHGKRAGTGAPGDETGRLSRFAHKKRPGFPRTSPTLLTNRPPNRAPTCHRRAGVSLTRFA